MFETLVLLLQLCSATPCVVITTGPVTLVTVCDEQAVDNAAWKSDRTFAAPNGAAVLIIKHSSAICSTI
jgi:hypothetical protein